MSSLKTFQRRRQKIMMCVSQMLWFHSIKSIGLLPTLLPISGIKSTLWWVASGNEDFSIPLWSSDFVVSWHKKNAIRPGDIHTSKRESVFPGAYRCACLSESTLQIHTRKKKCTCWKSEELAGRHILESFALWCVVQFSKEERVTDNEKEDSCCVCRESNPGLLLGRQLS